MQTTFEVSQDWGDGLVGFVTIENSGSTVLEKWDLTIETTFDIETLWGGNILEQVGNRYTIGAKGWNSRLGPGEIAKFGFVGHNATADRHQVTVIPKPLLDLSVPEPAVPSTDLLQTTFEVSENWGHGLVGFVHVENNGPHVLDDWVFTIQTTFDIDLLWGGEILAQQGRLYTVRAKGWNSQLDPGEKTKFGFVGRNATAAIHQVTVIAEPLLHSPATEPRDVVPTQGPLAAEAPLEKEPVAPVPAVIDPPVTVEPEVVEESLAPLPAVEAPPLVDVVAEPPALQELPLVAPVEKPIEKPVETGAETGAEIPVAVPGVEQSSPEPVSVPGAPIISDQDGSLYGETLQKSLLFYEAQRSGDLPDDNRIAWRGDSALQDGADVGVDLTGGYYDAGDHVKFGLPMAASITMLSWGAIEYQDAYQQSGQYDELLAAIKWGTDYFLKAHISDGQSTQALYGQVGDPGTDHEYWGAPEDLTLPRPAYKIDPENPGSDLAAETAAALASASIVFRSVDPTYAAELLVNAQQLYAFADSHRGRYSDSIPEVQSYYNSWSGYTDELAWGAAWLYKATGEQQYLAQAQANYQNLGLDWTHSWDDKSYGTGVLLAQLTDGTHYRSDVETWLDSWTSGGIEQTEGGLAWLDQWGSLRYSANTALLAGIYSDTVNFDAGQYDRFSRRQIDYILGDNPAQQSYVAGVGDSFPQYIHHRGASGTTDINAVAPNEHVLYGALVGGPRLPHDFSYVDERTDFLGNEVALDYNAGLTGAVARLYGQDGGALLSDAALIALSETSLSETGLSEVA